MFPNSKDGLVEFIKEEKITSLQVVLKITERCNIACTYCYYFFSGDDSSSTRSPTFSLEKVDELIKFLLRGISQGVQQLKIVLHGGEPLLIKKEKFSEVLTRISNALSEKVSLSFSMQTNAILIDDDWIEIFRKFNIFVGVSIDGPENYNDLYRIDRNGKGTYQKTIRGVEKLFSAHKAGLIAKPGVICVINPEFNAKIIYDHLTRNLGFDNLHYLYQDMTREDASNEYLLKVKEYTQDLINAWISDDDSKVRVRFLNDYLTQISISSFRRDVIRKYNNLRNLIITIDSNGDIGPEDTLRSIKPNAFGEGNNISSSSVYDLFDNESFSRIYFAEHTLPEACINCEWSSVCGGGHLKNRYSRESDSYNNKSIYCDVITDTLNSMAALLVSNGVSIDEISKNVKSFNPYIAEQKYS